MYHFVRKIAIMLVLTPLPYEELKNGFIGQLTKAVTTHFATQVPVGYLGTRLLGVACLELHVVSWLQYHHISELTRK